VLRDGDEGHEVRRVGGGEQDVAAGSGARRGDRTGERGVFLLCRGDEAPSVPRVDALLRQEREKTEERSGSPAVPIILDPRFAPFC
jgi:hypothetical protein